MRCKHDWQFLCEEYHWDHFDEYEWCSECGSVRKRRGVKNGAYLCWRIIKRVKKAK